MGHDDLSDAVVHGGAKPTLDSCDSILATWTWAMKILATMLLVASVALVAPIAIGAASAQTKYQASKPRATARSNEVRAGGKRIVDPDPFIQGEVLRHRNSGWPD
jgi:hypothetical protein